MSLEVNEPRVEEWLTGAQNRKEWRRLATALELGEEFHFFALQMPDSTSEEMVGNLLRQMASELGRDLVELDLSKLEASEVVAEILAAGERLGRQGWLFVRSGTLLRGERRLGDLFLFLNQKRDVLARRIEAPFLLALHPQDWLVFRRHAPDFWSIHQAVFRFGTAASPSRGVSLGAEPAVIVEERLPTGSASEDLWPLEALPFERREAPIDWERLRMPRPATLVAGPRVDAPSTLIHSVRLALAVPAGMRLALLGPPGIGKTTFLAEVIRQEPRPGVLWLDLERLGRNSQERIRRAQRAVIARRYPAAFAAGGPESLPALYRRATHEVPDLRLLIFEGVQDAAEVEALLPDESCGILVVGTPSLEPPEPFNVLSMGPLNLASSRQLLQSLSLTERDYSRLAQACLRHPLLLQIAGRWELEVEEVVAFLEGGRRSPEGTALTETTIRHRLENLFDALEPNLRKHLEKLALFEGPFDEAGAARILKQEPAQVHQTLRGLAYRGWLPQTPGNRVYELHGLVRRVVRAASSPTNADLKVRSSWVAEATDRGEKVSFERADLVAAVDSFLVLGIPADVRTYGGALGRGLRRFDESGRAARWYEALENSAEDPAERLEWLEARIDSIEDLGMKPSVESLENWLALAFRIKQPVALARVLEKLGAQYLDSGRGEDLKRLVKSVRSSPELFWGRSVAGWLCLWAAWLAWEKRDLATMEKELVQLRNLAGPAAEPRFERMALLGLTIHAIASDGESRCIQLRLWEYYQLLLQQGRGIEVPLGLQVTAKILRSLRDTEPPMILGILEVARGFAIDFGFLRIAVRVHQEMADLLEEEGNFRERRTHLQKAAKLLRELDDPTWESVLALANEDKSSRTL